MLKIRKYEALTSVGIALDLSYTCLDVFLLLTQHEFHIYSFLNTSTVQQKKLESWILKNARVIERRTVVSVTPPPRPHNFLIYTCAILLPWFVRLRNWEVINRSITSSTRNITHSNNIVAGYIQYIELSTTKEWCHHHTIYIYIYIIILQK